MNYTTHYAFKKPDYSDQYDLADWNFNSDKLDDELSRIDTALTNEISNREDAIDHEVGVREDAIDAVTDRIDDIEDGTTTVGKATKAYQDEDGTNIKTGYQKKALRTSWQSTPDNTHYPSEKLVKDSLDGKAASSHTHTVGQITNLQSLLEQKLGFAYKTQSATVSGSQESPTRVNINTLIQDIFTILSMNLTSDGYNERYASIYLPSGGNYCVIDGLNADVSGVAHQVVRVQAGGTQLGVFTTPSDRTTKQVNFVIIKLS